MGLAVARRGLHAALDPSPGPDGGPSALNRLIVAAIVVSVAGTVLETEETVAARIAPALGAINMALGLLFLLEHHARLWVATEKPGHGHPHGVACAMR